MPTISVRKIAIAERRMDQSNVLKRASNGRDPHSNRHLIRRSPPRTHDRRIAGISIPIPNDTRPGPRLAQVLPREWGWSRSIGFFARGRIVE